MKTQAPPPCPRVLPSAARVPGRSLPSPSIGTLAVTRSATLGRSPTHPGLRFLMGQMWESGMQGGERKARIVP